jgi:hypothetical protein
MTENVDTYVLPEESDQILAQVLPATDPLRVAWEVLAEDEKEGFLSAALQRLENLNFVGERAWYLQPLKFPRIARNIPVNFDDAPLEVKKAQVVWAAEIVRQELFVKRRNTEACLALGFITTANEINEEVPARVRQLLHRWLTSWRRV